MNIPLTAGYLGEAEQRAATQAIQRDLLTGGGAICKKIEQQLQEIFQCEHALELAMLALDIGPGDIKQTASAAHAPMRAHPPTPAPRRVQAGIST